MNKEDKHNDMDFRKHPGETVEEYLLRCYDEREDQTWEELAAEFNRALDTDILPDSYRRKILRYRRKRDDEPITPARQLEMKKQQFRDERNAWQRQNREAARTAENFELLTEALEEIRNDLFSDIYPPVIDAEPKTMLILLTDWHIGENFSGPFGEYNPEMTRDLIKEYLHKIWMIQKIHKCEKAVVLSLGDQINGSIRRTVQLQNRINWIEQVKRTTELITNFNKILCQIFPSVEYSGCSGNHSRLIESKEDAVKDERADLLIDWMVSKLCGGMKNFQYIEPLDSTLTSVRIYGREVIGVHGDYDKWGKAGVHGITDLLQRIPAVICYGHLHSPATSEEAGVTLIRGGSLAGTGDDYTVQKRIRGGRSQTVAIFSQSEGLEAIYPIKL